MKFIKLTTIIFWYYLQFSKDLIVGIGGDIETFDHCCANFIQSHHAYMQKNRLLFIQLKVK